MIILDFHVYTSDKIWNTIFLILNFTVIDNDKWTDKKYIQCVKYIKGIGHVFDFITISFYLHSFINLCVYIIMQQQTPLSILIIKIIPKIYISHLTFISM